MINYIYLQCARVMDQKQYTKTLKDSAPNGWKPQGKHPSNHMCMQIHHSIVTVIRYQRPNIEEPNHAWQRGVGEYLQNRMEKHWRHIPQISQAVWVGESIGRNYATK